MKAYFRLLFAFIALGMLAAAVVGVLYVWENLIQPQRELQAQVKEIKSRPKGAPDHGLKIYADGVQRLRTADLPGAISKFNELIRTYPESAKHTAAKRVVGEINIDRLLSKEPSPGKAEYIVQSGDSMSRIASKTKTSVGYIMYVNGRMGSTLQRGDQLIVCPLEYSLLANLGAKTLTLQTAAADSKDRKFVKEYKILGYKAPPGVPSSFDTSISALLPPGPIGKAKYVSADKELRARRRGISLRSRTGDEDKDKYLTGIFLAPEDVEELTILVRPTTVLNVRK